MSRFFLKLSACTALFIGAFGFASPAHASIYKIVTSYETVVTWETRTVPYTKLVLNYDECGKPFTREITVYDTVRVPVKKVVAVQRRIKICD